jgi:glycerol-3-phosphate O-acyltransferase
MTHQLSRKTVPDFLHSEKFRTVPGLLDREPSRLMKRLAGILSSRVMFDDQAVKLIQELSQSGPVVYALKYPSYYDLQYFRMRLAALGLPLPCFLLDGSASFRNAIFKAARIFKLGRNSRASEEESNLSSNLDSMLEIFSKGGAGVFFLIDEGSTRDRYLAPEHDPISVLLEAQGKIPEPIAIVPVSVLYYRRQPLQVTPFWETLLGDPDRPGPIQRILIRLRKWAIPELLVGAPVHLIAEFEEFGSEKAWEDLPFEIRRELIENINDRIRVNRGPQKLSRMEIKERVLKDPRMQKAVSESAASDKTSEENTRKKAEGYVDEIAADQRIQMIHFLYYALRVLFKRVFERLDVRESDFAILKKASGNNSLIFVSCHKSHFDYLVVGYVLFMNQMPLPLMAAGKNLTFWPVGYILRRGGAFFIRRSFRGLMLYTRVFSSYVQVLLKEKININFYIEGGRSRTGKFLQPKIGMLGFILDTVFEGAVDDLTFVPTYVGYDQNPEEKSYLQELRGREKQKESFFSFLESRKVLKTKYGAVYVRFHLPVSFREFLSKKGIKSSLKDLSSGERRQINEDFAFYLMTGVSGSSVVTVIDLVAAGFVCHWRSVVEKDSLFKAINFIRAGLIYNGIELSETTNDNDPGYDLTIEKFKSRKFIDADDNFEMNRRYTINELRRVNLEFYKNALLNSLWSPALLALSILQSEKGEQVSIEMVYRNFQYIKNLMNKEFIFDPLTPDEKLVERDMRFFQESGWVRFSDSLDGIDVLDREALEVFKGLILDLFAVYKACASALDSMATEAISESDFVKLATRVAEELNLAPEGQSLTLPRVAVRNALEEFTRLKIAEFNHLKKRVQRGKAPATDVLDLKM